MYPYPLITFPDGSGISLYEIFIVVGVIAAIVLSAFWQTGAICPPNCKI